MLKRICQNIEKRLYRRGITSPEARRMLMVQILLADIALAAGLLSFWYSPFLLVFGLGAAISSHYFLHLAKSTHKIFSRIYSPGLAVRHFLGFIFRLIALGAIFLALVLWAKIPVIPLLAGLMTSVISLTAWSLTRALRHTFKEA